MENSDILTQGLIGSDLGFLSRPIGSLEPPFPVCVAEDCSILEALSMMKANRLGCLLITNADDKLSGIFTERDALFKVTLSDLDLETTKITSVMTPNPGYETTESSIASALQKMSKGGYRHMPLKDDEGYPVGIISVKDIMDFISVELMKKLFSD